AADSDRIALVVPFNSFGKMNRPDVGEIAKGFIVALRDLMPPIFCFVHSVECPKSQRRLKFTHPIIVADPLRRCVSRSASSMISETPRPLRQRLVVGEYHPPFAGGEHLAGMKTEKARDAECADRLSFIVRTEAAGGVFDQDEPMLPAKFGEE